MFDNEDFDSEYDAVALVAKYENVLNGNDSVFFDVEEIRAIVTAYVEMDKINPALDAVDFGIEMHGNDSSLKALKGEILLALDREEHALDLLREAFMLSSWCPDTAYSLAMAYARCGKSELSIDYYLKAEELGFEMLDELYCDLSCEYQQLGDYEMALAYVKKAIALNPESESLTFEAGICYNYLTDVEEGIGFFNNMLESDPYNFIAWFNLGNLYLRSEEFEKALVAFDYSLVINEEFPAAYYGKANAFINMEKYREAIDTLKLTFQFEQAHAYIYCNIGECYEKMDELDLALTFYEKSIELDPNQTDAWLGIGIVKDLKDLPHEAIKYIEKALHNEPDNSEYLYIYAETLVKLNRVDEAREIFQKVVELDPENIDAWLDFSNIEFEKEEKNAIQVLRDALRYNENNEDLQYRLVAYLYSSGDQEGGLNNLRSLLSKNYDSHEKLFDYYPEAKNIEEIVEVIAGFKRLGGC